MCKYVGVFTRLDSKKIIAVNRLVCCILIVNGRTDSNIGLFSVSGLFL